jgi:hypothetical protein
MNKLIARLQFILPFLVVIVVIIATLANFSGTIKKLREGDAATLSLVLITVLMIAYGVERYVNYTQLDERLSNLETQLSTAVGGRLVNKKIYDSAATLLDTFENKIRTVVVTAGPKTPPSFAENVAQKLKERKKLGYAVKYEIVLVLSANQVVDLDHFEKANNDRIGLFNTYGVADAIALFVLESNTAANFDVMIVDRNHVYLGYSLSRGIDKLESAILFENQPQLAQSLADWFDGAVLSKSVPWKEWIKEQRAKREKAG